MVADNDGQLQTVERPFRILIFNIWQKLVVGGKTYVIWFPPDYGAPARGTLEARAGLHYGQHLPQGRGHCEAPGQRRRPFVRGPDDL